MDGALPTIPLTSLLLAFVPSLLLVAIMHLWSLQAVTAVYANLRMLVQLLAIGYVLNYIFETSPFDVFLEVVPVLDLAPDTEFDFNAAIGARFFF